MHNNHISFFNGVTMKNKPAESNYSSNSSSSFDEEFDLLPSRKKAGTSKKAIVIVCVCIAIVLIAMASYFIIEQKRISEEKAAIALAEAEELRRQEEERRVRYETIMSGSTVPQGVTINGQDLGGMTESEAMSALRPVIEAYAPGIQINAQFEGSSTPIDLSNVAYSNDAAALIKKAIKEPQSDSIDLALAAADRIAAEGRTYEITFTPSEASVKSIASSLANQINHSGSGIGITNIDRENHTIETSGSTRQVTVRQDELSGMILNALTNRTSQNIQIPCDIKETASSEYISVQFDTSFKGSSSSRIFNIQKGADLINGTKLAPGETFSTNDTLGVRTLSRGWKEANAYVSGTTEIQAGGGVCQLSSTLYNAAVKADLKIVSRRNHSMPVSYIDKGLDATINSVGNMIDFKFSNNTDNDIVIFSWTEGKNVYFKIYRVEFDTDEYDEIRLTAEKIETLYPDGEMEVILDPTLEPGTEEIDVATQNGAIYQSYKHYYKDGKLVRTEKLALSTYKAFNGSKRVGPDPVYVDPATGTVVETPDPNIPVITDPPEILPTPEPVYIDPDPPTDGVITYTDPDSEQP